MNQNGSGPGILERLSPQGLDDPSAIQFGGEVGAGVGKYAEAMTLTPGDNPHTALMRGVLAEEHVGPVIQMLEKDRRYKERRDRALARQEASKGRIRPRAHKGLTLDGMSSGAAVVMHLVMATAAVGGRARGQGVEALTGVVQRQQAQSFKDRLRRKGRADGDFE